MSKRGYISRYLLIIKKIKAKPYSTFNELQQYIANQIEFLQTQDDALEIGFSQRTLQRDLKEIRNIFGIDIEYSKKDRGYFIADNEAENMNFQRMIEAFDLFNSLNIAQDLKPFIQLEKRKPLGTENLYGILHAIKNKLIIKFNYCKFEDDILVYRTAQPYALKEFKSRWYLLANEKEIIKNFALDRLTDLEITKQNFQYPKNFNIDELYQYCFGITNPINKEPEEIILSFNAYQANYIKTLPLHESQEVIMDNEDEVQIKLMLHINHELIMELLSFGDSVKILKPNILINEIRGIYKRAGKLYN